MKKIFIIFLLLVLIITGCSDNRFKQVCIRNYENELSEHDAKDFYDFINATIEKKTTPGNAIFGPYTTHIIYQNLEKKYSLLLNSIIVTDKNGNKTIYEIEYDYYISDFYPFLSKLCDKYFPVWNQLTCQYPGTTITKITAEEECEVGYDVIDENVALLIADAYYNAENYDGDLNEAHYQIVIDDGIVNECLYFFDDFVVLNNRKIMLLK